MIKLASLISCLTYEKNVVHKARTASDDELQEMFGNKLPRRSQTIKSIRDDLRNPDASIALVMYRPFDVRMVFYSGKTDGMSTNPRRDTMQHFIGKEGYFFNRINPLDLYSKPVNFEKYDKQLSSIYGDKGWLLLHPFSAPIFQDLVWDVTRERDCGIGEALAWILHHADEINLEVETRPEHQTDEPRNLARPLSYYNKGRYPDPEKIKEIVDGRRQSSLIGGLL